MPRDHLSNVQSPLDFQVLGIRTRQLSSWQPYRGPPARNQVARNFNVTFRVLARGLKVKSEREGGDAKAHTRQRGGRHDEHSRAELFEGDPDIWITSYSEAVRSEVYTPVDTEGVPSEVPW